jgi:hypothetical protein
MQPHIHLIISASGNEQAFQAPGLTKTLFFIIIAQDEILAIIS